MPHKISLLALRWMVLGEWRAHPARVVLAALAVAVGVALGFAVHVVNLSALGEFARAIRTVNGNADLQVRSTTPAGFDQALYPVLARLAAVDDVSPVVQLSATDAAGVGITLLGLDILRAANVTPSLVFKPATSTPFDPDAIYLSQAAVQAIGCRIGDKVRFAAGGQLADFTVAGLLPGVTDTERLGVIDIAAAQARFEQLGRLQRIDLRLLAGSDPSTAARAIRAVLPQDAELVSAASEAQRSDSLSRAYRVNLEMLAMVALLTGGFLVFSAQSLSVARRRPQFALLRVLGQGGAAQLLQVILEGGIVGLIGAVLGIALGYGLAMLALHLLGGDLGGGYFAGSRPAAIFPVPAALLFGAMGVAVALAGSVWPALDTLRAEPAVSLKNSGDLGDPRRRPGIRISVALLALGGAAALAPPVWGLPLFGYAAMAALLAGGVAAMPFVASALLAPLQHLKQPGLALDLAVKRLWGAPNQASVALCGIVASTSLMIAMAVMVSSFRGSVEDWLTQVLSSDLYLRIEDADAGGMSVALQDRLTEIPGIAAIRFRKTVALSLASDRPEVTLIAQPIDPANPGRFLPLLAAPLPVPKGAIAVYISEPMQWLLEVHPGQTLRLPLAGGAHDVFVAGVWRDYARQFGAVAIDAVDYSRLTGDVLRSEAAIALEPGASSDTVSAAIRAALPPELAAVTNIAAPREIRRVALQLFDRSFAATYALEAIAIAIGLTGVAATLSAQILARTKEFGMLRHIGVTRGQIVRILAVEGALLGMIGGLTGLGLGLAMGEVLIQVVNPQSFHWTMSTRVPWGLFIILFAGLIAASAGTSVLAGRRALSQDAVRAVREDW
jgi:putative ABC transport system permease protein